MGDAIQDVLQTTLHHAGGADHRFEPVAHGTRLPAIDKGADRRRPLRSK